VADDLDLAAVRRGSVTAAAGCGKTELIAASIAHGGGQRELVLTHTNAGVDALRRRLRDRRVSPERFAIDTIAGWCLKYVASYPKLSCFDRKQSDLETAWVDVYRSATKLMVTELGRRVLSASYSGIYVDEYQDCLVDQHALIVAIAAVLPTRVLGDPLQAVFRFAGNDVVPWSKVQADFPPVATLTTPHRWLRAGANQELGKWLGETRDTLLAGRPVNLTGAPVRWIQGVPTWQAAAQPASLELVKVTGNVVGVCKWPSHSQHVGMVTGGAFQCIEPIEGKNNIRLVAALDSASGSEIAEALYGVVAAVSTGSGDHLRELRRGGTINPELLGAANAVSAATTTPNGSTLGDALRLIADLPGIRVHRRELLWAIGDALVDHHAGQGATYVDSFRRRRNMTSRIGRRLARCSVGSTLLVKGMQFDHGIVFDAGEFSASDIYVALTRASASLTVVSPSPLLRPM